MAIILTYLVTNGDDVKTPYFYVVVERSFQFRVSPELFKISRFPLTAQVARAELFKGVAIPSPLAERQLTGIPSTQKSNQE